MAMRMSDAVFRLAYDGEAVRDGEMDVAALAPALLGLAQLLKAAGRVIDGDGTDVRVRVQSTREGSFEVWLSVAVESAKLGAKLWDFLKTPDGQAAAALLSLLGIGAFPAAGGAIQLVRHLAGRRPQRIAAAPEGFVAVEVDGVRFEVPEIVARLALDGAVRAALEKVVAEPLGRDGIESVSLGSVGDGPKIEKAEASYFKALPATLADEFVSRYTKAFSIATLSFKPGQKWRLNDGGSPRSVIMSDAEFQERVDTSQEAFAKGDILVCEVVETSRRTPNGFRSDYEIVRVVQHRRAAAEQASIFDAAPSDAGSEDA